VKSYSPKSTFSENHISTPKGCCAPKFLHAVKNDQVLLAHPPSGTEVSLQLFKEGSKIGLKFSKCAPLTFAVMGVAHEASPHDVSLGGDDKARTTSENRAPQNSGKQKTSKNIGCNLGQLSSLTANISGMHRDIDKML